MTDEKLIEESFKAHEDAPTWQDDPVGRDSAIRWHMRGFEDARAVFEKAHAASGDEREALAVIVRDVFAHDDVGNGSGDLQADLVDAFLAFRRPVSPEPQGEPTDAQVIAALNAYHRIGSTLGDWGSCKVERMHAALRAADAMAPNREIGGQRD